MRNIIVHRRSVADIDIIIGTIDEYIPDLRAFRETFMRKCGNEL